MAKAKAKRRIAWGITGSGDRITETVRTMIDLQKQYDDVADVRVFVSKAGEQVIKYYKLFNDLEKNFDKVWVEINANSPFLAGQLQLNRYDFLLLAPTTSNTVAKISLAWQTRCSPMQPSCPRRPSFPHTSCPATICRG